MASVLGYWDIRGLAQHIRLLLEFTGTKYEDKRYVCGPAPDYDKSCWLNVKDTLGLDFPNLPYYIDGNTKVTQSNAIMRYIARKHDLCGKTEEERVRVDMLENEMMDFRNAFVRVCYYEYETGKDPYIAGVRAYVKKLAAFLGKRPWMAGDNISFVDFILYELLDENLALDKDCLNETKSLQAYMKRFEELEPINKYMASPRFIKYPIHNRAAFFGN